MLRLRALSVAAPHARSGVSVPQYDSERLAGHYFMVFSVATVTRRSSFEKLRKFLHHLRCTCCRRVFYLFRWPGRHWDWLRNRSQRINSAPLAESLEDIAYCMQREHP